MKKVERKLEQLEDKIQEQRETISQLQADNAKLQRLKVNITGIDFTTLMPN